jgi:trehalose 6-phosphate synthase
VLLLDFDGTLAPFRVERGAARPIRGALEALRRIAERGVAEVAIVTGRPAAAIPKLLPGLDVEIYGGHGFERLRPGRPLERVPLEPAQEAALRRADGIVADLGLEAGRIERKYASVSVHVRGLDPDDARQLEERARQAFRPIARRGHLEILSFNGGVELRARGANKGTAVRAVLSRLPEGAFAVYLGDDTTDEDAFEALRETGRGDGVLVRARDPDRPSAASYRLAGSPAVLEFLRHLGELGAAGRRAAAGAVVEGAKPVASRRLVVISNRLPKHSGLHADPAAEVSVGGLVSAIRPALERSERSVWFGWSGRGVAEGEARRVWRSQSGEVEMLGVDLAERDVDGYYYGFCNRALWPILHCFPGRAVLAPAEFEAYERVNALFARAIERRLRRDDRVWVQDYHLLLLGRELRRLGFRGRIGIFLHVPFPPPEIFTILPAGRTILEGLAEFDVVGFHTEAYARNYARTLEQELGPGRRRPQRVGAYPIGIDPGPLRALVSGPEAERRGRQLRENVRGRQIILGVDRLDYTKGIPERLRAFARLLELEPRFRRQVSFVQISAPSRTRIPEYVRQRREVEELVGHVNGAFGEADWVPVRYLFRPHGQRDLAVYYREADVCFVSPLRDGMNIVAKEFVAAQAEDPGVLVLSRFAGAAEELREALIVNPHDIEGTARALGQALDMPAAERARRQAALLRRVETQTAARWAATFERDLAGEPGSA